jgi:sortase A
MSARRTRAIAVLGELLLTTGVLVFLFVGWYLWLNVQIAGSAQARATSALQQQWASQVQPDPVATDDAPSQATEGPVGLSPDLAPVPAEPTGINEPIAGILIPRFGSDWARTVGQDVTAREVLNSRVTGIGHYPGTGMPGEVGNFAIAGHRTVNGGPFGKLPDLRPGDHIYFETIDGWYEYSFRGLQYVTPEQVEVIAPVPNYPGAEPVDRVLTMTTCNPLYSAAERAIGYAVMTAWYPRSGGAPLEVAAITGITP